MVWQTYDYYFEPTGAYFGCKKASEPLHIQFNSYTGNVEVVNISGGDVHATAKAEIFTMNGEKAMAKEVDVDSNEDSTVICFPVEVPADITDVYFIRLKLLNGDKVLSENFYWQGKEEGNYQALRSLANADVDLKCETKGDGEIWKSSISITNKSDVPALMLRLKACNKDGGLITPVIYSDNYVFLMPGESRTIDVEVAEADAHGAPAFAISGFNL